jgi:hypothetical protein
VQPLTNLKIVVSIQIRQMGNPNKNPAKPNKSLKLLFLTNSGNPNKNLGKLNKK